MSETRARIQKQLEKSAVAGSIVRTDVNSEQEYVAPGGDGQVLTIVAGTPTWSSLCTALDLLPTGVANLVDDKVLATNTVDGCRLINLDPAPVTVFRSEVGTPTGTGGRTPQSPPSSAYTGDTLIEYWQGNSTLIFYTYDGTNWVEDYYTVDDRPRTQLSTFGYGGYSFGPGLTLGQVLANPDQAGVSFTIPAEQKHTQDVKICYSYNISSRYTYTLTDWRNLRLTFGDEIGVLLTPVIRVNGGPWTTMQIAFEEYLPDNLAADPFFSTVTDYNDKELDSEYVLTGLPAGTYSMDFGHRVDWVSDGFNDTTISYIQKRLVIFESIVSIDYEDVG